MTAREALTTLALTVLSTMGAVAVPFMADSSTKIIIGTGLASFATTGTGLLAALGLDPRSKFLGDKP